MNAQDAAKWAAQFVGRNYPFIEAKANESGRPVRDVIEAGLIAMIDGTQIDRNIAQADGGSLGLTYAQGTILLTLLVNAGQVVPYETLTRSMGINRAKLDDEVDVLRERVGSRSILRVTGEGYIMLRPCITWIQLDHGSGDTTIGRTTNLTPMQVKILSTLAEAEENVLSAKDLTRKVGAKEPQDLWREMRGLREALGRYIVLRHGNGYALGWPSEYTRERIEVSLGPGPNELTVDGCARRLQPKQMLIVRLLLARPGRCVSHEELMKETGIANPNTLRAAVFKTNRALGGLVRIISVSGRGYRLDV